MFTSVPELLDDIDKYVDQHNVKPQPFIWAESLATPCARSYGANARLSSRQNEALHSLEAVRRGGR